MTFNQNADQERTKIIGSDYTTSGETTLLIDKISGLIDGFEDGDVTEWTVSTFAGTINFSAQQSTTISGSFTGELESDSGNGEANLSGLSVNDFIECKVRISQDTGSPNDESGIRIFNSGGSFIYSFKFEDDNGEFIESTSSTTILSSWSASTTYTIKVDFDFANDQADIFVDGVLEASGIPFFTSSSKMGEISFTTQSNSAGVIRSVFMDDIRKPDTRPSSITLSSSDASSGKIVRVVDTTGSASSNSVTIDTESSELINGETSATLNSDYEGLTLQSDGSDWFIISRMSGGTT